MGTLVLGAVIAAIGNVGCRAGCKGADLCFAGVEVILGCLYWPDPSVLLACLWIVRGVACRRKQHGSLAPATSGASFSPPPTALPMRKVRAEPLQQSWTFVVAICHVICPSAPARRFCACRPPARQVDDVPGFYDLGRIVLQFCTCAQ